MHSDALAHSGQQVTPQCIVSNIHNSGGSGSNNGNSQSGTGDCSCSIGSNHTAHRAAGGGVGVNINADAGSSYNGIAPDGTSGEAATGSNSGPPAPDPPPLQPRPPAGPSFSPLEQVLQECREALLPHLDLPSRRCLRLTCRPARTAIDASVTGVIWSSPRSPTPASQVFAVAAARWPGTVRLTWYGRSGDCIDCLAGLPPRLQQLHLDSCLQAPRWEVLAPLTQACHAARLTDLRLESNALGMAGCEALAQALRCLSALTRLVLHECGSTQGGMAALAPALATLRHLSHLQVSHGAAVDALPTATAFAATALPALAHSLEVLDVSQLQLGSEGGAALSPGLAALTRLRRLYLDVNHLGLMSGHRHQERRAAFEPLAAALSRLTALTKLSAARNHLGGLPATLLMPALAHCTRLQVLDLDDCGLGSNGDGTPLAAALAATPALTYLSLALNKLGDVHVRALPPASRGLTRLASLNLSRNLVYSAADLLQALAPLTSLTRLGLTGNALCPGPDAAASAASAAALMSVLGSHTLLEELDLGGMALGDVFETADGVNAEPLRQLGRLRRLRRLQLGHNRLGPGAKGAEPLAAALTSLTRLTALGLGRNAWGVKGLARLLPALSRHVHLHLLGLACLRLGPAAWQGDSGGIIRPLLQGLPCSLRILLLNNNGLTRAAAAALVPGARERGLVILTSSWQDEAVGSDDEWF